MANLQSDNVSSGVNHKRNLSIDLSMCTITGTGVNSLTAYDTVTVTVTAKDSGGINIGTGGETLTIEVHNECTLDSDYYWTEVPGATQVLTSPLVANMTDNGDGTYSYSYSVDLDGIVTVFVYKESYITGVFYDNVAFGGTSITKTITTLTVAASDFNDNSLGTASAQFYFSLIVPETNSYTFDGIFSDEFNMTLGNTWLILSFVIVSKLVRY